jgi:hypothetical protein
VRLLFIGESAPASGRFFYQGDSGLYRAMRDAFRTVDRAIDDENFFAIFQASGCYLIDLCRRPVDDLDPKPRRTACQAGEASLSKAIVELRPMMIATLLRSIEGNVKRALLRTSWRGRIIHLPYPGRWARNKKVFVNALTPIIAKLILPSENGLTLG